MAQGLYELPDGWEWKKLSQIATTQSGGTPSRSITAYWGGDVPWLKSGELGDSYIKRNEEFITQSALDNSSAKIFPIGALLIAMYGATAGKMGVLTFPAATNQAVCYINNNSGLLERDYIRYFLLSIREKIISDSFGGAQPNISQTYIKNIDVPLCSLPEQQRLVKKLDTLLSRIDNAIEHLKHSLELNDQLFASSLNQAFNPLDAEIQTDGTYQLPEGWNWKKVKEISVNIQYGHTAKASEVGNAKFLRITDIQDGKINWDTVPKVQLTNKDLEKYQLNNNDLVFARSGATSGKSILIENPQANSIFASYLIRIVPDDERVLPTYLSYYFQTPAYWAMVGLNASGAAQPNINGTKLGEFDIPVADLQGQQKIAKKAAELQIKTQANKQVLQQKLEQLQQLKASLLDSAFRGEL